MLHVILLADESSDEQNVNITVESHDIPTNHNASASPDESVSYLPGSLSRASTLDSAAVTSPSESIYDRVGSLWTSSFTDTISRVDSSENSIVRLPVPVPLRSIGKIWHQCGLELHTCRRPGFDVLISASPDEYDIDYSFSGNGFLLGGGLNQTERVKRVHCLARNISDDAVQVPPVVRLLNSSELLQQIGTGLLRNTSAAIAASQPGRCTVVLFYAPWCKFSAAVAQHYNALARAFPSIDIVAIDAYHFSHLNSRFGTIAVPNIVLFHNAKAVGRFNSTERNLRNLISFVTNHTGIGANQSVNVTDEDREGPLSSVPTEETDYLLILSWVFVLVCAVVALIRSSVGVRVLNTIAAIGRHEERQLRHLD